MQESPKILFLGLVNFSARFITNLASIAEPLHRLTRKQTRFVWGTEQQGAFDALKDSLTNADTLAYFDSNAEETKLITDASPEGLGAVLTQVQGGCEQVVAFASCSLTDVKCTYSQTEKEALELVWGCERFHMYLYGVEFTLLTDHKPLVVREGGQRRVMAQLRNFTVKRMHHKRRMGQCPQYIAIRNELSVLGKLVPRGTRLLIPAKLHDRVADLAHKGHQGLTKIKPVETPQQSLVGWN